MLSEFSHGKKLLLKAWEYHKQGDIENEKTIWNRIIERKFHSSIHMEIDCLLFRSKRALNLKPSDIPLFCTERNEMLRLPFFLEYYRNLGVTHFIFVDNNSNDGSFEFLLGQDDCYVFWTNDSYNKFNSGTRWINHLINDQNILHINQWYIIADADEFLVYPKCETNKLPVLINYLNIEQSEVVPSFMLDMFPKNLKAQHSIQKGDNLIKSSPYFINDYNFFNQITCPYVVPRGGFRDLISSGKACHLVKTALFKKTSERFYILASTHSVYPAQCSKLTSSFLHFKFIGDFKKQALTEIKRKEHFLGGARYKNYYNLYESVLNEDYNFTSLPNTETFKDSQQLVNLGLIKCPDEWLNFIKHSDH